MLTVLCFLNSDGWKTLQFCGGIGSWKVYFLVLPHDDIDVVWTSHLIIYLFKRNSLFRYFFCSKTKMVIELLEGIHFVASIEAISLGSQAGIHPWILYDIISNAAGNSWWGIYNKSHMFFSVSSYFFVIVTGDFLLDSI